MGFMDTFTKIRQGAGRLIGGFGSTVKKIGDFGANAIRKIGEFSQPVAGVAASIASALGQQGIADGINKVGNTIARYSPAVENILQGAGDVGSRMRAIGNYLT